MSTVHNNRINIADYFPNRAQVVRSIGGVTAFACRIGVVTASYIASVQVAKRFQITIGDQGSYTQLNSSILNLDDSNTYPFVPAAFATAAIGFHILGKKISSCTIAWAKTLETVIDTRGHKNLSGANSENKTTGDGQSYGFDVHRQSVQEAKDDGRLVVATNLDESEA